MKNKINIFWFRRDLRLEDNAGLSAALASGIPVLPLFIFDTEILGQLEDKQDRRVDYIHQALTAIDQELKAHNSGLHTYFGTPLSIFTELQHDHDIQAVYCNRDYEPQAIRRDQIIGSYLSTNNIAFHDFKDQVIFEKLEISKEDGKPYSVYTPYAKKWRNTLQKHHWAEIPVTCNNFLRTNTKIHSLEEIGFTKTDLTFVIPALDINIIKDYGLYRDYPALQATTELGIALRFGSISIRKCVAFALKNNDVWLSELIWREFFMQILFHFPHVETQSFKSQYDSIAWRNNEVEFSLWCDGKTGYPIVDAGMRQLNETGYMHNRVRMIVASFLCKHLLIDWRWGERYFAQKLNDYDLSANNGNWQWAAGSGCDAAPYFRIFNPTTQTQKFDKDLKYTRRWNPNYEQNLEIPIVAHEIGRERALKAYKKALQETR